MTAKKEVNAIGSTPFYVILVRFFTVLYTFSSAMFLPRFGALLQLTAGHIPHRLVYLGMMERTIGLTD